MYSGYGITFGIFLILIIFDVDNSSSSHSDNRKNNLLVLGEGPSFEINGSFRLPEKRFSINFTKANSRFFLIVMLIIFICLLLEKSL